MVPSGRSLSADGSDRPLDTRRPGEEFGERVSMNRQCFHRTDGDGGC